ncbi:MAG: hypothetical protein RIG63_19800 [Coleofasciculus chthonoplastes F3-SA18-01]
MLSLYNDCDRVFKRAKANFGSCLELFIGEFSLADDALPDPRDSRN